MCGTTNTHTIKNRLSVSCKIVWVIKINSLTLVIEWLLRHLVKL